MPSEIPKEIIFDKLFSKTQTGVCVLHLDGSIELANPAMSLFFGYTIGEIEGRNIEELTHAEDRYKCVAEFAAVLRGERECLQIEKRARTKLGKSIQVEARGYPLHYQGEIRRFLYLVIPLHDIDKDLFLENIEERLRQLEVVIERHDGDVVKAMTIHVGDSVGGDSSGRDKVTNDAKIFRWLVPVFISIAMLLAYIAYYMTVSGNGDEVKPPTIPIELSP